MNYLVVVYDGMVEYDRELLTNMYYKSWSDIMFRADEIAYECAAEVSYWDEDDEPEDFSDFFTQSMKYQKIWTK